MSTSRYSTVLFKHPLFDRADDASGLMLSSSGKLLMVDDEASVRQSILLLLSTSPGERVMRPDYGCNLQELVFAPNDHTTAGLAIHYVRQAVRRWEPRAEIIRVDACQDENDPGKLNIELEYRVKGTQKSEVLKYSFSLNEDEK